MLIETTLLILFAVAVAVALLARRLQIPYTVGLVAAGLALGASGVVDAPLLTKHLLYSVFLPALVFEAAFHLEHDVFRRNTLALIGLAVPGLGVAIGITAAVLAAAAKALGEAPGFGLAPALVFSCVIAATDPIAVVSIFRTLGVPRRLAVLVEGESLLNDGTAIVVFSLVLSAMAGSPLSFTSGVLRFLEIVFAGAAIGGAVGLAISKVIRHVDDPMIQITLTTLAAWGSFALGESLHTSGVIATVAAGMICGNYGAMTRTTAANRLAVETFWEYVAFAFNSLVFLLVGFEVSIGALLGAWKLVLLGWLAMTLARAVMILLAVAMLRRTRDPVPWSWSAVLVWGGLRGALSIVLVLSLPPEFPFREAIVNMTFGVVVLGILLQGLTMGTLLRALGFAPAIEDRPAA